MNNLLSNAAKYSVRGSRVEMFIENHGTTVRVNVRDFGQGIPEEFRGNIFSEFYQVYAKGADRPGGTGLGLSIAKSIVDSHGGTINYTTESGAGTTFYFDLPVLGEDEQAEGD